MNLQASVDHCFRKYILLRTGNMKSLHTSSWAPRFQPQASRKRMGYLKQAPPQVGTLQFAFALSSAVKKQTCAGERPAGIRAGGNISKFVDRGAASERVRERERERKEWPESQKLFQ